MFKESVYLLYCLSIYRIVGYFMSISVFFLRKYGLSFPLASSLAADKIELVDLFFDNNPKLLSLYSPNKIDKLSRYLLDALIDIKLNTDIFDNVALLESCGNKLGSSRIYNRSKSISEFNFLLDTINWKSEGLMSASEKLRLQIEKYNQSIRCEDISLEIEIWNCFVYFLNNTYIFTSEIESEGVSTRAIENLINRGYLEQDESEKYIFLSINSLNFKDELIKLFEINKEFYIKYCQKKKNDCSISFTLEEYLKLDFPNKDFFKLKLEGFTLQEIGNQFGITRERVRQKINKIIKEIPNIVESEKYQDIFTKCNISKDIFTRVFNEDGTVFEFLSLLYKRGKEDVIKYIFNGDFSDEIKQNVVNESEFFIDDGELRRLTRQNLILKVLKENAELQMYFSEDELFYLYCEEVKKFPNLQFANSKSMCNQLERYPHILFSFKKGYRYHSTTVNAQIKDSLLKIIDELPEGAYSMNLIFDNHFVLMKELEILDGSELHYFYKKYSIKNRNFNLGRNPEFVKGDKLKKDYILSELRRFNGKHLDEFVMYMSATYGLNTDSLTSYVLSEFTGNIANRLIYFKQNIFQEEVAILSSKLTNRFYEKNDFYNILNHHFGKMKVTNDFLYELGFVEKGTLIIKKEYRSAVEALTDYILSQRIVKTGSESFFRTYEFYNTISQLERQLKILKISRNSYINIETLRGFDKNKFLQFIEEVNKFVSDDSYFSIVSLIDDGLNCDLLDDGFELISLDRLIGISSEVKSLGIGFPNIYYKSNSRKNLGDFLIDELFKYETANVEDFTDDINQKYGLDLDSYKVRIRLIENGVYYSEILNKVYIEKEDYLNEVYGK